MNFFKRLFGPSQAEIWQQLAAEMGATFTSSFWKGPKVIAHVSPWTITLDNYVFKKAVHTRMRSPYINRDGFYFKISQKGMFYDLTKHLGWQTIELGDRELDAHFIIQSNSASKVRQLLANSEIRQLLKTQPCDFFQVVDDEDWYNARFPAGVDQLYFLVRGTVKDAEQLKALFELFAVTLHRLHQMGSADTADPQVQL